jgi:photosystem II stability/assembly factor-like uncharacterized protein
MNRKTFLLIFNLFLSLSLMSQNNWEWLNPKPSGYTGVDVYFISNDTGFIVNNNEILLTTNCGEKWMVQKEIESSNDINFFNSIGFIVGNNGYVLKTINNGNDWSIVNIGVTDNLNTVNIISEDTIIISSSNKLIKSFDGGNNWQSIDILSNVVNRTFFINSKTGHAACNEGKIMKTTDGGENWYITESVSVTPSNFFTIYFIDSNTGFASREHFDILKTTDGGETWTEIPNTSDAIYSFFFLDDQNGFISGDGGVIFKTVNGGTSWEWAGFQTGRIDATTIYALHFIDKSTGFAVGMRGVILKTTDGGQTWSTYSQLYTRINQITFTSDSVGYFLAKKIYKTTDKGNTWDTLSTGVVDYSYHHFSYISGCFLSQDTFFVIADDGYYSVVLKTENGGQTFEKLKISIYSSRSNSIFFVNKYVGYINFYDSGVGNYIYKTVDGGKNWILHSSQVIDQIYFVNENTGFGLKYGDLYRTLDGGITWEKVYEIYGDLKQMHFVNDSVAYVAGEFNTVLKTVDGGKNWIELYTSYDHLLSVCFYNSNVGFVTGESWYIYKTVNGGFTWEKRKIPGTIRSMFITENRNLFAAGDNGILLKDTVIFNDLDFRVIKVDSVTDDEATLSGIVASQDFEITNIKFEYGLGDTFDNVIDAIPNFIQSNTSDSVFARISNLDPDREYRYRLRISYNGNEYFSDYKSFRTLPEIEIYTDYVYNFSSCEAELTGRMITRKEDITNIRFQFGKDTLFNQSIDAKPGTVTGGTSQDIEGILTSLEPETEYFVRINAVYKGLEIHSNTISFTTKPEFTISLNKPVINGTSVSLKAYISANKDTITNIIIEYGTSRNYSSYIETTPDQIDLNGFGSVQAELTNLDASSIYFYRIRACQGIDTIYSSENILRITGGVIIVPAGIQQISDSSLILKGLINTNGIYIYSIQFEYGINGNLGDSVYAVPYYAYSFKTVTIQCTLDSLMPDTKYYFRIRATDGTNLYFSEEFTYTLGESDEINESEDLAGLDIFPNPTDGYFMIRFSGLIDRIEVINSNGMVIMIRSNENLIDLSELSSGLYYLRISINDKLINRKIIKN